MSTLCVMAKAKKPAEKKKTEPVSLRVDLLTMNELESIGEAMADIGNAKVSTSALVDAAIKEYIEKRRDVVDKYLPKVLRKKREEK